MVLQFNSPSPRSVFPRVKAKMRISGLKYLWPFLPLCARGDHAVWERTPKLESWSCSLPSRRWEGGHLAGGGWEAWSWDLTPLPQPLATWKVVKVVKCFWATRRALGSRSPDCRASVLYRGLFQLVLDTMPRRNWSLDLSPLEIFSLSTGGHPAAAQFMAHRPGAKRGSCFVIPK